MRTIHNTQIKNNGRSATIRIFEYTITWDSLDHIVLPKEAGITFKQLNSLVHKNPAVAIQCLEILVKKYPDIPQLLNHLASSYENSGNYKKAIACTIKSYRMHPNYLFAKCNYAAICMKKGKLNEVKKIFDNKYDLMLMYPERTVFHISEFIVFVSTLGKYFFLIKEISTAKLYLEFLKQLAPSDPRTIQLEYIIMSPENY